MKRHHNEDAALTPVTSKRYKQSADMETRSGNSEPISHPFTDVPPPAPTYDFRELIAADHHLRTHYAITDSTIDFRDRGATLSLTRAILRHHFNLSLQLPSGNLTPTIPNRTQYLHWAFSLLPSSSSTLGGDKKHDGVTLVDIGTGPSCIYSMLAVRLFPGCKVIATDTDKTAINSALANIHLNQLTADITVIEAHKQANIIPMGHQPSLTVCNPPFHDDDEGSNTNDGDHRDGNTKHSDDRVDEIVAAGTAEQMHTPGGELAFITRIAHESVLHPSVHWFTSLIGCKATVPKAVLMLRSSPVNATAVRTVRLCPGSRTVRWAIAWTFGSSQTSVGVLDEDPSSSSTSSWRGHVKVTPGRIFANQLTALDMADVCVVAMVQRGWYEQAQTADGATTTTETTTTGSTSNEVGQPAALGERSRTVVVSLVGSTSKARIALHVTGPSAIGTFSVTVKTEVRARMTVDQFRETCDQLTKDVPRQLDELSSS